MVTPPQGLNLATVTVPLQDRSYNIRITDTLAQALAAADDDSLGDLSHVLMIADEAVFERWTIPLAEHWSGSSVRVAHRLAPGLHARACFDSADMTVTRCVSEGFTPRP